MNGKRIKIYYYAASDFWSVVFSKPIIIPTVILILVGLLASMKICVFLGVILFFSPMIYYCIRIIGRMTDEEYDEYIEALKDAIYKRSLAVTRLDEDEIQDIHPFFICEYLNETYDNNNIRWADADKELSYGLSTYSSAEWDKRSHMLNHFGQFTTKHDKNGPGKTNVYYERVLFFLSSQMTVYEVAVDLFGEVHPLETKENYYYSQVNNIKTQRIGNKVALLIDYKGKGRIIDIVVDYTPGFSERIAALENMFKEKEMSRWETV